MCSDLEAELSSGMDTFEKENDTNYSYEKMKNVKLLTETETEEIKNVAKVSKTSSSAVYLHLHLTDGV
jgi:hypothetical protein